MKNSRCSLTGSQQDTFLQSITRDSACICSACKKAISIKGSFYCSQVRIHLIKLRSIHAARDISRAACIDLSLIRWCASCSDSCHMGCIVNKFVTTNRTALRNSVQWLTDFLHMGNFHFLCNVCSESKGTVGGISSSVATADASKHSARDVSQLLSDITQQISELKA